jgi:hypothetical protein
MPVGASSFGGARRMSCRPSIGSSTRNVVPRVLTLADRL